MCSAAACSTCWIVIAISLGLSANGGNSYRLGIVAVSFFFLFFASFGMGVLGVPWLYPVCATAKISRTRANSFSDGDQRTRDEDERSFLG